MMKVTGGEPVPGERVRHLARMQDKKMPTGYVGLPYCPDGSKV